MNQTASYDLLRPRIFFAGVADGQPEDSDYALARAAAAGDVATLGDLYKRHNRRVYLLCFQLTHNAADAEDLTQEVFILLFRKIGSFRGESLFTTWLHRLTVNQVLMHLRHKKRRAALGANDGELTRNDALGPVNPSSTSVVDRIALDRAMSRLPPGYRAAFVLHVVEGYEHEEVARILGCSVGTSKSQLHKARKNLRRLLMSGR